MAIGVRILSVNLSGLTTNVTFLPQSGGTIDLGTQVFPFNYISDYYWGTYNCYVPTYATNYSVEVPGPTPTPTSTPTLTPTPTAVYYYYFLLSCDSTHNKIGRSVTGGLSNTIYNPESGLCYQIVGSDNGPSFDYDLDELTTVPDCSDANCQSTPTPTPTNTETPTNTPTNTETPTPTQTPS